MTKPYRYQRKGVRKISHFGGRALLADEMGLGKSFQALLWMKKHPKARPVVIICPASLKWNWENEASKHLGLRAEILEGRKPPKRQPLTPLPLIIINYDILGAWLKYLRRLRPQLVILDESHYIQNRAAKRTKCVQVLCKRVPYIIALSGTPLTNRPAELWPTLNLLRPDLFPAFSPFANTYCQPKWTRWGWQYKGAEHMDELHAILNANLMIRRLKADVLDQLPPKTRVVVPLGISNRKEYQEALHNFLGWLAKQSKRKAKKAKKAERMVKVGYLKRLVARLKLPFVFEWIDDFLQGSDGKLVLFGVHKIILHAIHDRYKRISVLVDGSVVGHKRQAVVEQFKKKAKTRLLIGNMKAAGVGLNMTEASDMAFVELGWTPGEHGQAEDRIHRIGQRLPASCYYLVAKGTVEETICKLIQEKQKVLDQLLDGKDGNTEMDIYDQLEKELTRSQTRKVK